MLPWNKRRFQAVALLIFLFSLDPCHAQVKNPDIAFLKQGPFQRNSIEILPANTYRSYWAEYEVGGFSIQVFFTQAHPRYSGVREYCSGQPVLRINAYNYRVYAGELGGTMTFFFVFPDRYPNPCNFISAFIMRFEFFWNTSGNKTDIPFPAVLELSSN